DQVLLAGLGRGLAVGGDDLSHRVRRVLDAGDQAVSVGARELGRLRAARRHQDWELARRRGVELGGLRRVVLAVEGQLLAPEEAVHDLKAFLHAGLALGVPRKGEAEWALVERLAS